MGDMADAMIEQHEYNVAMGFECPYCGAQWEWEECEPGCAGLALRAAEAARWEAYYRTGDE